MKNIDLHTHTTFSDGSFSPQKIVDLAIKQKIRAFAITDHNSILGVEKAIKYARGKNIEVIPGIEIECSENSINIKKIHIIGLFIDYTNQNLISFSLKYRNPRFSCLLRIIKIFLRRRFFGNLLAKLKITFIKKPKIKNNLQITLNQAISIIKSAGGIAFLAHPGMIDERRLKDLLIKFISYGGDGIETDYPYYKVFRIDKLKSDNYNKKMKIIASKKRLLASGGSDFHGYGRNTPLGECGVDEKYLEKLKKIKSK